MKNVKCALRAERLMLNAKGNGDVFKTTFLSFRA